MATSVYDMSHVKSVSFVVLAHPQSTRPGNFAGRIVANWSDNPAGSVCTAQMSIWEGPLSFIPNTIGKAGGYGYDKLSAAIESGLWKAKEDKALRSSSMTQAERELMSALKWPNMGGAGFSVVRTWLGSFGYTVVDAIGAHC
jgi:hypothetical protein